MERPKKGFYCVTPRFFLGHQSYINCFRFAIPAEADWGFEALRLRGLEGKRPLRPVQTQEVFRLSVYLHVRLLEGLTADAADPDLRPSTWP